MQSDGNSGPGAARIEAQIQASRLEAGLYLVATPIGTARDITLRALDVLNSADLLAAEDTRVLRHLMSIHGLPLRERRIVAYHDHSADRHRQAILDALADGRSVAYASDAGTPLIADPGFRLAREAIGRGQRVHAVPGASAVLAALTLSGLPSDRFLFAGFPPVPKGARTTWLRDLAAIDATAVLFESPRRVKETLEILCEIDPDRDIVLCRELTKKFEEVMRGKPDDVAQAIPDAGLKGEIVLLLDRPAPAVIGADAVRQALSVHLGAMSVKDAARTVAEELGLARREVYQMALVMAAEDRDG
ncbi:16S rRNA (cytidine(1402)-2'-O)-methyltransferase [Paracoccus sp. TK19116]|uniref:Ribosomal RNA small subunit methyltransferase I n=1 Tax=Paracoccus albicereus TaxID=2922394 RepID=A0ABT1MQK8_9RHOB|nr:16S rRNA (cytidine(1402)-2'-O)-methyltransferase [Paracoccus albicereus]MCQ0970602.1 16S rRNA (cytidine(1402)-2'-O)-methyltransferase [Paracoccus albicereus]